jgi:hypothetical protein
MTRAPSRTYHRDPSFAEYMDYLAPPQGREPHQDRVISFSLPVRS